MRYSALIFFLIGISVWGQNIKVTGKIEGKDKLPLSYAYVTFENQNNVNFFKEQYTEEDGSFSVELPKGSYIITIQPVDGGISTLNKTFTDNTSLGIITIKSSTIALKGLEVIGQKPLYRLELDKRVYDMERDPMSKGASLSEALNNVPSVEVDSDGSISLRGNSNLRVLINGKPSAMTGISNIGEALKNTPADAVNKVEVITNPSARYDAEGTGGIINIIMKNGSNKGFNANLSSTIGYQLQIGLSANMNYKTNQWNFFFNPNIRYGEPKGNSKSVTRPLPNAVSQITQNQMGEKESERFSTGIQAGIEHYIDKKTTLSLSGNYRYSNNKVNKFLRYDDYLNNTLYSESLRKELGNTMDNAWELNFDFKKEFNQDGHELTLNAGTSNSWEDEDGDIHQEIVFGNNQPSFDRKKNNESQRRNRIQLDYILPLREKERFEFGYKGEWKYNTNDFSITSLINTGWIEKNGYTDVSQYDQNVQALYTQYGGKYGHFSYLLGLRMENTNIRIQSEKANSDDKEKYTSWFPSATFNYMLDNAEKNQIQVSYSRRIRRPNSRFLSPYRTYSDDRNTFMGNPKLDPVFNDSYEISYLTQIGKFSLTPSLYYRYSKNDINVFRREIEENGIKSYLTQPINVGNTTNYGLELVASSPITKWWRVFGSVNFFKSKRTAYYKDDLSLQEYNLSQDNFNWSGRITNNIKLPFKIDMQLSGSYRSPYETAQNKRKARYSVNLGLSKDILNGNGTLTFNVRDLLNSRKTQTTSYGFSSISEMEMQWRERQFTLTFSYRINQKKNKKNSTEHNEEREEVSF